MTIKKVDHASSKIQLDWNSHFAIISGACTSVLICLKVLAVAGWDSNTAFGILSETGTANVLTGALLGLLPVMFGLFVFLVLPVLENRSARQNPRYRVLVRVYDNLPNVLFLFIVPVYLSVGLASSLILYKILRYASRWVSKKSARIDALKMKIMKYNKRRDAIGGFVTCLSLFFFCMLLTNPWMPSEIIESEGTERTAYVLKVSDKEASVLWNDTRRIERIDSSQVTGKICDKPRSWLTSPYYAIVDRVEYPECPK